MRLLKFYASWCGPCKQQGNILEGFKALPIESIDVDDDDNTDIIDKYGIRGLPTILLLDDKNEIIKRFGGLTSLEEINEAIKNYEQN